MLSERYRLALQALKDQAAAVEQGLGGNEVDPAQLTDAQRRMAQYDPECKHIVRIVMKSKRDLTIPTLTEAELEVELGGAA